MLCLVIAIEADFRLLKCSFRFHWILSQGLTECISKHSCSIIIIIIIAFDTKYSSLIFRDMGGLSMLVQFKQYIYSFILLLDFQRFVSSLVSNRKLRFNVLRYIYPT